MIGIRKMALISIPVLVILCLVGFYYLLPGPVASLLMEFERTRSGFSQRSIEVEGLRFEYLEGGDGETLVLLHGFGANKDNWTRTSKHLTPHFRVIAPDLTGFGESSAAPDSDYTVRAQTERLKSFFQALGITSFHLGGNSMGGNIAGAYAAYYPEDVRSLLLLAPAGVTSADQSEMRRRIIRGESNPLLINSREDFDRLLNFAFVERPFMPHPIRAVLADEAIKSRELNGEIYAQLHNPHNIQALQELLNGNTVPTLIVWGSDDRLLHVSGAKRLDEAMPKAEVVVMDAVGHLPMLEKPRETAELYLEFLQRD